MDTGLCQSLGAARRAIESGGVYLDNAKVVDVAATLESLGLSRAMAVLRRGRKTLAGVFVE